MSGLNDTDGQKIWRMLMGTTTYTYASSLRESFREEGREEKQAEMLERQRKTVRAVIGARGLQLTDAHAKLIDDCADPDTLDAWVKAAVTAAKPDDIFR